MFSTFTGNSRRPRNVNLSGQATNPFSNTSWNPSTASNTTKTVTDAQADRERRLLERQRLKAASRIQRIWRGHLARVSLKTLRRSEFDNIYRRVSDDDDDDDVGQRLSAAFELVLLFFSPQSYADLERLLLLVSDCNNVDPQQLELFNCRLPKLQAFARLLVQALEVQSPEDDPQYMLGLLELINRLISSVPMAILKDLDGYCVALARMSRKGNGEDWGPALSLSLSTLLSAPEIGDAAYDGLAFFFLASRDLKFLEKNIDELGRIINEESLARAIVRGYASNLFRHKSNDELLWLLAHFIDLGRTQPASTPQVAYLESLYTQASALSYEISVRMNIQVSPDQSEDALDDMIVQPLPQYVSRQILSLVDSGGITKLLGDFSVSLSQSSYQDSQGTSFLAGYILTLLQSLPVKADDVRMRLFLEEIPSASGQVPILQFLWKMMLQTTVFSKLRTERERPVDVLRRYLGSSTSSLAVGTEEQEWKIVLLFLDLYIFILRLSDDEDFFSGIYPQLMECNSSTKRIRACSLSLGEVKALTTFLKNTAFTLHYKYQELTRHQELMASPAAQYRRSSRLPDKKAENQPLGPDQRPGDHPFAASTKPDLDNLRSMLTTALKMLYERDSRKRFLPPEHWLMTGKFEIEDFMNAVIVEERQTQEQEEAGSSDEAEDIMVAAQNGDEFRTRSSWASQRLTRNARIERLRATQRRALRERRLAEMGPKLEILKHIPFVIPFELRVQIFRQFIELDRGRRDGVLPSFFSRHHAEIRRGMLFEDAFRAFYPLGAGFKDPIQITFFDRFNTPEAGIDGGGVTKEFLISITAEAFANNHMFTSNEKGLLYPNPVAVDATRDTLRQLGFNEWHTEWAESTADLLKRFEFLGRIIGKCMYEGILVDLAFAGFFLLKWPSPGPKEENSYKGSINDLQDMDEELYKGLLRLKNYSGDVSELGLNFTVTDQISPLGGQPIRTASRKLISNGDEVPVTNDNRLLYISYTARHRLVVQPALQTAAFLRGLRDIIRPSWLSMFNQSELQRLVGGDSTDIDVDDLRRNTVYSGVYVIGDDGLEHPTIRMFWNVMAGFTDTQRRDVLKYVSSTPRAPLLGFSQLRPQFCIRDAGSDEDRLPSTSTCINLLKLPIYNHESILREKLLYAITSGAGFDLS